jgi:hypothetical protein
MMMDGPVSPGNIMDPAQTTGQPLRNRCKKRRADAVTDDHQQEPQPRRSLRRMYEACARCRIKKIKVWTARPIGERHDNY